MKMNVEFESKEELLSFVGMFGGGTTITNITVPEQSAPVKSEDPKTNVKPAAEKVKKDKIETKKEEQPKTEPTKVDAEVTGVDTTSKEPPKDAEVNEENSGSEDVEITSVMVRAICQKAIKAGKSAEVKNIVSKYGASKLPDLKEECYADAYKDVEALL